MGDEKPLGKREDHRDEFLELHDNLNDLERRFNPKELNLHFGAPRDAEVWPGLWTDIEGLAREGLDRVSGHRDYFLSQKVPSAMYEDDMFWYDLFLFIGAVSIANAHSESVHDEPSEKTLASILECLIDVSEYTAVIPADIFKRNWEALANFLNAFPALAESAEERAGSLEDGLRREMILGAASSARRIDNETT